MQFPGSRRDILTRMGSDTEQATHRWAAREIAGSAILWKHVLHTSPQAIV